jgi:ABC-2 type transport system ATP-binding protein
MTCIETINLNFGFNRNKTLLKNINIKVDTGVIYGLYGNHGAGKSTLMKIIAGLLNPTQGQLNLFDRPFHLNREQIIKSVGYLIEQPSLYTNLTAKENLEIYQRIYACSSLLIDYVLELVGLEKTLGFKTAEFSLGMKQRLGIAISILHNPKLLILDEPTNELDSLGIVEIRNLLTRLNKEEDTTILIASRHLDELEKLVTHVGILNNGELCFQGSLPDLLQTKQIRFQVFTDNSYLAAEILKYHEIKFSILNGVIEVILPNKDHAIYLSRLLINNGVGIFEFKSKLTDFEAFLMNKNN